VVLCLTIKESLEIMSPINLIPWLYPNLDKYMPDYRIFFSFELILHKDMNVCSVKPQSNLLIYWKPLKDAVSPDGLRYC
jgi:hypothetical protein